MRDSSPFNILLLHQISDTANTAESTGSRGRKEAGISCHPHLLLCHFYEFLWRSIIDTNSQDKIITNIVDKNAIHLLNSVLTGFSRLSFSDANRFNSLNRLKASNFIYDDNIFIPMIKSSGTRKHSGRMRTARLLPVSHSIPCIWGGVCSTPPLMQTPMEADPPWRQILPGGRTSPVNRMTHMSKNITLWMVTIIRCFGLLYLVIWANNSWKSFQSSRSLSLVSFLDNQSVKIKM